MKNLLLASVLIAATAYAQADEAAMCSAAAGAYRTGTIVKGPKFAHGQFRKGVELSHTHLRMKADQDGKEYDIAIDNVFASGFKPNQKTVPDSLKNIRVNDHVEACGQLYTGGDVGIHWVHTNCGKTPQPSKPDGWLKVLASDGKPGDNIESNTQYCSLFN